MDKLPDKILETTKTGKLSTALALNRDPSNVFNTETVVFSRIDVGCKTNNPVEKTVIRMTMRDPIVALMIGTCPYRMALDRTTNGLAET
jgi:hypothetical protein